MKSLTYGTLTIEQVAEKICQHIQDSSREYTLVVGTDSQSADKTKVVVVIALHDVGHGGIFFYDVFYVKRLQNVGEKLIYETQMSLDYSRKLFEALDEYQKRTGFDYQKYLNFSIHVDAGLVGPSKQVVPSIVGWIKSCGYDVVIKPDSFAACSVANKYSK